jgi:hypothetical protein
MNDRWFTRGCIVKQFGLDDLFVAFAVTLGGAQTVTILLQVEHGEGRHASELDVDQFNKMLMVRNQRTLNVHCIADDKHSTGGSIC